MNSFVKKQSCFLLQKPKLGRITEIEIISDTKMAEIDNSVVTNLWGRVVELPDVYSYSEFHEAYGQPSDARTRTGLMIARALHIDNQDDSRQHHLVIRQSQNTRFSSPAFLNRHGQNYLQLPYEEQDFMVVTFDGAAARWWDVVTAEGRIYGAAHVGQIDCSEEEICLEVQDQHSSATGRVVYSRATKGGYMDMDCGKGWILSKEETQTELEQRLRIESIGCTAMASSF